ncbi:MAG: ABC transporter ATP-binding protein [Candidatus Hydrogenedentes bacterium]|nr:ABC transporter ATP-binding protein [Candidatus Hydrogenedentota bacterium]
MLYIKNLGVHIGTFTLRDISFTVNRDDYFVLLGASGIGKTLLLEALAGLIPLKTGSITRDEEDITHLRIQKRGMGLVYQNQALFPHLTVLHNITYGISRKGMTRAERLAFAHALAEKVGVNELLHRYPNTLSGGEAQRVALARALATKPRCLLLDEPLASLDPHARSSMRTLLRSLHRNGQMVIHVTHDYEEALSLATQVGIMEQGTLVQTDTPTRVFQHPTSEFVARFVGIRNVFPGMLETSNTAQDDTAVFVTEGKRFRVLTSVKSGAGILLIRSEDITLSLNRPDSSAQNCFEGIVTDKAPARLGLEICVNIGVEIIALITSGSAQRLHLHPGSSVWLSFKASAARFIST